MAKLITFIGLFYCGNCGTRWKEINEARMCPLCQEVIPEKGKKQK